ncbi:hypothetical protein Ancab_035010 [Ancistrocladus abbreviatus]
MSGNEQMEVHYINTGYPYTVTESFMNFFEGVAHAPDHYIYPCPVLNQESIYWSANMSAYKYDLSEQGGGSYYGSYEVDNNLPRTEVHHRDWEYSSAMHIEEPMSMGMQYEENVAASPQDGHEGAAEECILSQESAADSEVVWQDDVDPDNMSYEELLDLGDAVGTQNRGLPQELIKMLPTSRFKAGGFFSRKKIRERCVICLLTYKIGDQQITLPCKHVYHKKCGTKWLSINKTCPVCNGEVFGSESRH